VPDVFKQAIKAQAGHLFNNRDSDKASGISPEAMALIKPHMMIEL
jgi:hypothetical protein